jgi:hypothetical protein
MSPDPSSPQRAAPPPESYQLRPRVFAIGLAALAIFGLTVLITEWARQAWTSHLGQQEAPAALLGASTINELYQRPFALEREEADRRAAQEQRLHGYGWVDRAHGVIHVPIDRAKEELIRESQGRGGSGP